MNALRTVPMVFNRTDANYKIKRSAKERCIVCGRPTSDAPTRFLHLVEGGAQVLHRDDELAHRERHGEFGDPGDCGLQPVGSECVKLFSLEYVHVYSKNGEGS